MISQVINRLHLNNETKQQPRMYYIPDTVCMNLFDQLLRIVFFLPSVAHLNFYFLQFYNYILPFQQLQYYKGSSNYRVCFNLTLSILYPCGLNMECFPPHGGDENKAATVLLAYRMPSLNNTHKSTSRLTFQPGTSALSFLICERQRAGNPIRLWSGLKKLLQNTLSAAAFAHCTLEMGKKTFFYQ